MLNKKDPKAQQNKKIDFISEDINSTYSIV